MTVWFITGTTSGLGEALVRNVLSRGDRVIASGRNVVERLGSRMEKSDNIAYLELDITADQATIDTRIKEAWRIFGSIDVLINNAGATGFTSAEEADDAWVKKLFDVNLFGSMRVTAAILPFLRAQGQGRVGFISSSSAWVRFPFMGHYGAAKAALSAYVEALHKETSPLGIRCVAIECGGMQTLLGHPREPGQEPFSMPKVEGYLPLFGEVGQLFTTHLGEMMAGDVAKVASATVDVISQEGAAKGKPWYVRVPLGSDGWHLAELKCKEHLQVLDTWKDVSFGTDNEGTDPAKVGQLTHKITTVLGEE